MNITIDIPMLIAKAKQNSGLKFGEMAKEIHAHAPRISQLIAGEREATTDEIAYFAKKAGLPVMETVIALRPQWAEVWQEAANDTRERDHDSLVM